MTTKITHLIGQLGRGGAEKQLYCLARALQGRGWPQSVIAFDTAGEWERALAELGVPVFHVRRHPLKPWRLWRLWRLLRRERPRILMTWTFYTAVYARWLVGVGKPRTIVNLRGNVTLDVRSGRPAKGRSKFWGIFRDADYVVSNSQDALDVLRVQGVPVSRYAVVRNIVAAPGRARPGEKTPLPRIAAAGALTRLKAYDVLLEALGRLAGRAVPFELCLAGDGAERANLEGLAARLGIANRVRFLGEVLDVPAMLATAHLLVHPSRTEGLSNTILEAMAEGLPVVAARVGGNPELIDDGRTGILVPPDAPEALGVAIRRLVEAAELRQYLGDAALERARELGDEATIASQYEEILQTLATPNNRPRG